MNWRPNWQNEKEYPDPKETTRYQWAWEFLRRNERYQDAWDTYQHTGIKPTIAELKKQFGVNVLCDPATTLEVWKDIEGNNHVTVWAEEVPEQWQALDFYFRRPLDPIMADWQKESVLQPKHAIKRLRQDTYVLYLRLLDAHHDLQIEDDRTFLKHIQPILKPTNDFNQRYIEGALTSLASSFQKARDLSGGDYLEIYIAVTNEDREWAEKEIKEHALFKQLYEKYRHRYQLPNLERHVSKLKS